MFSCGWCPSAVDIQPSKYHVINTADESGVGTYNRKYNKLDFTLPWQTAGRKETTLSIVHIHISSASVGKHSKNCSP